MELKHKTPCSECPWRRIHPAGWLGGYAAEEFINQVNHDGPPLPCHKTIPTGGGDARAVCAGSLIFMRNTLKSHRDPAVRAWADEVEEDVVAVFQWSSEFLSYHNDPEALFNRVKARREARP